jgi:hypothetical protein
VFVHRVGYLFAASCVGVPRLIEVEVHAMLTKKSQAISGVSPEFESVVEELYPSIACTGIGQVLNGLYESIPVKIWGVTVSHVFALITAPIGALVYLLLKVVGSRYILTNRNVKRMNALGYRLVDEVPLTQIAAVSIDPDSRLGFYATGDIRLTNASGDTLMLLRGIPYPDRYQQVIQEMCDAKSQVASSLAKIQARK